MTVVVVLVDEMVVDVGVVQQQHHHRCCHHLHRVTHHHLLHYERLRRLYVHHDRQWRADLCMGIFVWEHLYGIISIINLKYLYLVSGMKLFVWNHYTQEIL